MKLDSANVVVDLFRAKFSWLSGLFKDIIGAATINKVKFWCAKQTACLHKCYAIHTALVYFTEVYMCSEALHTRLECARLSGEFSYSLLNADCLEKNFPNYSVYQITRSTLYTYIWECLFAVSTKTTARIDAKRSGIMKNDPKSVLCRLKSPILLFSVRYRDISGFHSRLTTIFTYLPSTSGSCLDSIVLTQSAFTKTASTMHHIATDNLSD